MASDNDWQANTIKQLLFAGIQEQRRARRWGIFFKLIFILYMALTTALFFINKNGSFQKFTREPFTAVINLDGVIKNSTGTSSVNANNVIEALNQAFKNPFAKAIILNINSPGGSPVQSRKIYYTIKKLRDIYPNKKIYAVISDMGTSGAYLVACSADEIYADKTSLVGSIGVVLDSFGFVDAINKLGIERRLYTAGDNKGMLDPFSPRNPKQEALIKESLNSIHQAFIDNVKQGRGNKLIETNDIFSGRIWVGEQAKQLGLIDDFGDIYFVAEEIIKTPNLIEYKTSRSILEQLSAGVENVIQNLFIKLNYKLIN